LAGTVDYREDAGAFEIPLETAKEANCPQMQRYKCSKRGWKDVGAMGNLKDPPGQFMNLKAGVTLTKS
jgi:hypothetical protein